ncbi:MAG: DUF975 family protein, partial [Lachnospiraceae bacterium]|nr:DUF975 family protein [Lachnospiraceae bacterium]
MNTLSVREIKSDARVSLLTSIHVCALANMLFLSFFGLLLQVEEAALPSRDGVWFFVSMAAYLVVAIFMGVFQGGLSLMYLKAAFSERPRLSDLFVCVAASPDKMIIIRTVLFGAPYLILFPAALYLMKTGSVNGVYVGFLFLALFEGIAVHLIYGLSYFVALDFPEISARQALVESKRLTSGYRKELLKLHASFIPLYLLGILSFGLAEFWITAYHQAALAAFYKRRITKK